jgi:colicin import membrane protein
MRLLELQLDEIDRRGFLKGLGAAAISNSMPNLSFANDRDKAIEALVDIAGTVHAMRRIGYSRSFAMSEFETKMGFKGELLRATGIICNMAWSFPKDHFTKNEFISSVRSELIKNLPRDKQNKDERRIPHEREKEELEKEKLAKQEKERHKAELAKYKAELDAEVQANLKRLDGMAHGREPSKNSNNNAKFSANYGNKISSAIRPNILYTGDIADNTRAVVSVSVDTDGNITSRRLIQPSGNNEWDSAVLKAIDRTKVIPKDLDGRVPSELELGFTPKDR